jgi:hypothetical protein
MGRGGDLPVPRRPSRVTSGAASRSETRPGGSRPRPTRARRARADWIHRGGQRARRSRVVVGRPTRTPGPAAGPSPTRRCAARRSRPGWMSPPIWPRGEAHPRSGPRVAQPTQSRPGYEGTTTTISGPPGCVVAATMWGRPGYAVTATISGRGSCVVTVTISVRAGCAVTTTPEGRPGCVVATTTSVRASCAVATMPRGLPGCVVGMTISVQASCAVAGRRSRRGRTTSRSRPRTAAGKRSRPPARKTRRGPARVTAARHRPLGHARAAEARPCRRSRRSARGRRRALAACAATRRARPARSPSYLTPPCGVTGRRRQGSD